MTDQELDRGAKRRFAILRHAEEATGNVAATCRYYGITRQAFYNWKNLYDDKGLAGLREKSRRPHTSPNATSSDVVGKIIHRRQNYHFGPHKIAMYLQRYHDVTVSPSGIWRVLKRFGMNRLPSSQRYKRHTQRWKRISESRH